MGKRVAPSSRPLLLEWPPLWVFISKKKNQAGEEVPGIVLAKESRLRILALRGYLTLSSIQPIRQIRSGSCSHGRYDPKSISTSLCVGILIDGEDGNVIGEVFRIVRFWLRELQLEWNIRYCLTDDSATEQCAVRIAFPEKNNDFSWLSTCFVSGTQSKHWVNNSTTTFWLKRTKAALFNGRTEAGFLESI